jgi:hypothetical protein
VARRAIGIEATADDKASEPLARVAEALKHAADEVANADTRLTSASAGVVKAQAARIPAAQRVKLELEREAAAGDATRERLAELALESAQLEAQLLKLARANKPIPAELLQAANAARSEAAALREVASAANTQATASTDAAKATAELARASAEAQAAARADRESLEAFVGGLAGSVASVAAATAAAGTTAAAGLFALAKSASEAGDRFFVLSDKLGVGTEQLSRLAFAAKQNGATFEQLQTALQALSNRAARTPQEFERIGVSVRDAAGALKAADVLFAEVADAISKLPPGAARVAAAQALMEEGGRALVPVLQLGASGLDALGQQADRLGVTLERRAAVQANAFGNELAALDDVVQATARNVGLVFVPAFTEGFRAAQSAVGAFNEIATGDLGALQGAANRSAAGVVAALASIVEAYEGTRGVFDEGGRILGGLQALDEEVGGVLSSALERAASAVTFGATDLLSQTADAAAKASDDLEKLAASKRGAQTESSDLARRLRTLQEALLSVESASGVAGAGFGRLLSQRLQAPQELERILAGLNAEAAAHARAERARKLAAEAARRRAEEERRAAAEAKKLADAHVQAYLAATDVSDFEAADAAAAAARTRAYEEGLREEERAAAERDRAEHERLAARVRATTEAERARTLALEAEAQRRQQIEQSIAGQLEGTLVRAYQAAKDGPKSFADFALGELERILVSTIARQLAGFIAGLFGGLLGGGAGGAVASVATSFATGGLGLTAAPSPPPTLPAPPAGRALQITFNQSIPSSRAQLRRDLRDRVLPELRALERG